MKRLSILGIVLIAASAVTATAAKLTGNSDKSSRVDQPIGTLTVSTVGGNIATCTTAADPQTVCTQSSDSVNNFGSATDLQTAGASESFLTLSGSVNGSGNTTGGII